MQKLPVIPAITHMWQSTVNNLWFALRAQWPWIVVTAVVITGLLWLSGAPMSQWGTDTPIKMEDLPPGRVGLFVLSIFLGIILMLLAFSSVAVSWHRYVLLDEVPVGMQKLRVDATVWRYLGNLILIGLLALMSMLPMLVLFGVLASISATLGIGVFMAYTLIVVTPIIYRLSIKLPAVALGRRDFKMGDAWHLSRGNWWQIVGVALIVSVITWVVGFVMTLAASVLIGVLGPVFGFGISTFVQAIINWIFAVMGITLLTSFYGFFVEKRSF